MKSPKYISPIVIALLCGIVCFASARTLVSLPNGIDPEILKQEQVLNRLADNMIRSADTYSSTGSTRSESEFVKRLVVILSNRETFKYNFPGLRKYDISLFISDDKRLKIYSWQSPYSGSMWHTQNVLQYLGNDNQVVSASFNNLYAQKDDGTAPSPVLDKIYKINNAKAIQYLLTGYGQMSGTEPYSVAHLLNITDHKFNINKKLFILNKKPDNEIYVSVNVAEDEDVDTIRKKMAIRYDVINQKIIYPLTKEVDNSVVLTGETRQLQFKNGFFK
jgi:hypothetical protein